MSSKSSSKSISLEKILFSQGFGTKRYCRSLVFAELVKVNGQLIDDPEELIAVSDLTFDVDGKEWVYHEKAYIVFNKPSNYECSHKTKHHPSIYSLLPPPLIERGIQCVGRLDQDTTGLLLLSDDGQFIHQMTTPKKNIGKTYLIQTTEEIQDLQIERLLNGVVLDDDPTPCFAKHCSRPSEREFEMTIVEGRYHQVKRMVAAAGNHVAKLHRISIGNYVLPENLPEGEWRWLNQANIDDLYQRQSNDKTQS